MERRNDRSETTATVGVGRAAIAAAVGGGLRWVSSIDGGEISVQPKPLTGGARIATDRLATRDDDGCCDDVEGRIAP